MRNMVGLWTMCTVAMCEQNKLAITAQKVMSMRGRVCEFQWCVLLTQSRNRNCPLILQPQHVFMISIWIRP